MKKILFLLGVIFFLSCEKDDICIEQTTPSLIIKFYDSNTDLNTALADFSIKEATRDYLFENTTSDSIALPLNPDTTQTTFKLEQGLIEDTIQINYSTNPVFVSKSCGFKTLFNQITISNTTLAIDSIVVIRNSVNDQNYAHLKLYY